MTPAAKLIEVCANSLDSGIGNLNDELKPRISPKTFRSSSGELKFVSLMI